MLFHLKMFITDIRREARDVAQWESSCVSVVLGGWGDKGSKEKEEEKYLL